MRSEETMPRRVDRPLTDQERHGLIRGLETPRTGEYMGGGRWLDPVTGGIKDLDEPVDPGPLLEQVDGPRVVIECARGEPTRATISFQDLPPGRCATIIHFRTEDQLPLILDVDRDTGLLGSLEIT
jgi:hypothetical protein